MSGEPDFAFPGGESFAQQGIRVAAALAGIEEGALPALVVCHGGVIRIALFQRAGRSVAMGERVPNGARRRPGGTPRWWHCRLAIDAADA